jgi:S-adenosylmethionine synthetase
MIGGEVTSSASRIDAEQIAKKVYREIGYDENLEVLVHIEKQSPDIAQGVDTGGAGDQGIMYGYATDETPEMMPKATALAHKLAERLAYLRRSHPDFFWLGPDGKTQVTMDHGRVKTVLVSSQHAHSIENAQMRQLFIEHLIGPVVGDLSGVEVLVNPTGRFVVGGFAADTGLTGRKLMVDTYGGLIPHGGGAFSGKDPTKVDRSAAYMGRFAAKNLVANGYAHAAFVSVAYAIGRAEPLMLRAVTNDGKDLTPILEKNFDFRPRAIIERLNLRRPLYRKTAAYGHFGKEGFPWEEVVKI